VQLQAIQQLFTIAGHRSDRYRDAFSMTMVEVRDEKLFDLLAGTPSAERSGEIVVSETRGSAKGREDMTGWRNGKLEIRTNIDGNTIVQGLVSVPLGSFEDALALWQESIASRADRLGRHGRRTNIIATVHITSVNIATGVGTEGKLQFVDMAASDIMPNGKKKAGDENSSPNKKGSPEGTDDETQFANRSIDAFNDVVNARCQFDRSVPYRNSTLTHLLRDSLEADAKVLLVCCVSGEKSDVDNTAAALKFASRMQKVSIGKATKHIASGNKE
jgi:kinesin family protein C2/C3